MPIAGIFNLLHSPRSKKTGRARRTCRPDLVDLCAKNVPAQRPAPTSFQPALFLIGHHFSLTLAMTERIPTFPGGACKDILKVANYMPVFAETFRQ